MTPERWRRVEDLFHATLELPAESRAASLSVACGDDIELLVEVQHLLQADANASAFVAAAGLERVAAMVMPTHSCLFRMGRKQRDVAGGRGSGRPRRRSDDRDPSCWRDGRSAIAWLSRGCIRAAVTIGFIECTSE